MHNIGADHNFGSKTVEQQQQHHDNAARSTDVIPTRKPASKPIADIPTNDFIVGGR